MAYKRLRKTRAHQSKDLHEKDASHPKQHSLSPPPFQLTASSPLSSSSKAGQAPIQTKPELDARQRPTGYYIFDSISSSFLDKVKATIKGKFFLEDKDIASLRKEALKQGTISHDALLLIAAAKSSLAHPFISLHKKGPLKLHFDYMPARARKEVQDFGRDAAKTGLNASDVEKELINHLGKKQQTKNLIQYAKTKGIDLQEVYEAALNAAADSTRLDKVLAAMTYVVAKGDSHPLAARIKSGTLKVDAVKNVGSGADGVYSGVGGTTSSNRKGDTLYLKSGLNIFNLVHRGLIIHELSHAIDDFAQSSPATPLLIKTELTAYRKQAKYWLSELSAISSYADMKKKVKKMLGSRGLNNILTYALALEAKVDSGGKFYLPYVELLSKGTSFTEDEIIDYLNDHTAAEIEDTLKRAILATPMYSSAATKKTAFDGAKGITSLDTLGK